MECKDIQLILPAYVDNAASAKDISLIEGHLAVCNNCRRFLSELLDKPSIPKDENIPVSSLQESFDDRQEAAPQSSESIFLRKTSKRTNVDEALTPLEYAALIVAIIIFGFIVFIFVKG